MSHMSQMRYSLTKVTTIVAKIETTDEPIYHRDKKDYNLVLSI